MNSVLRTLGIAALLAPSVAAQADRRAGEPKPLQELLNDLGAKDSRTWSAAMAQLVALGDRAVPALRQVVRRAGDEPAGDAVRAVQVLQRIGAPAAVAVPDLLALLRRLGLRDNARSAVILAVGELVPYAPTQRAAVREAMFDLLAQKHLDGINRLLQIGTYIDECRALARTELGPETAEGELARQLAADNPFVREFAALLLADRSAAGEATIAALQKALRGPHPNHFELEGLPHLEVYLDRRIQAAAARAMLQLAPKDPRSVEAFALLAERTQSEDRLSAVIAVRQSGAAGAALVPQLMNMAKDEDPLIRREAITTLGTLGPIAAPAATMLERLCADRDPQIAERARAALKQVRR
jgi:hypothetical protein